MADPARTRNRRLLLALGLALLGGLAFVAADSAWTTS